MKHKKQLGLIHIICIATGAMISSGLFILPGLAHARTGPAVVLSYLLAGLAAGIALLSIAELTTAMPKAGGDYFYISRVMGPAVGTISGILSWFCLALKSAFALVGVTVLVQPLIPFNAIFISLVLLALFSAINIFGIKGAARFQVTLVIVLVGIMIYFLTRGLPQVEVSHFENFIRHGYGAVFSTAGFVFVSYGGLLQIASIAGEIKQPGKNIPKGMIIALILVTLLYTLMIFVTSGVLIPNQLNNSLTPISDAAGVFLGPVGQIAIAIAAALAFLTTANSGIMTASRYLFAVSDDGLMPAPLSWVSKRFSTPLFSILVTTVLIFIALFVNLDILVEAASTVFILGYMLASLSVIVLRESRVQNYRPSFKVPFYPWTQLLTLAVFAFILLEMGEEAYLIMLLLILISFAFYWFYGRKKVSSEYALLHLLERITARELVTGSLENELKDIIRERDKIVQDRFDHLIEQSKVLEINQRMRLEEFFQITSEELSQKMDIDADLLYEKFIKREKDSSTVLSPALAVPHIVVPGQNKFEVMPVRCKEGIRFSKKAPEVHAIFIIAGTKDQRNFYLRVLSAIAQIFQSPDFENKWLKAKDTRSLRDLILLSPRQRSALF